MGKKSRRPREPLSEAERTHRKDEEAATRVFASLCSGEQLLRLRYAFRRLEREGVMKFDELTLHAIDTLPFEVLMRIVMRSPSLTLLVSRRLVCGLRGCRGRPEMICDLTGVCYCSVACRSAHAQTKGQTRRIERAKASTTVPPRAEEYGSAVVDELGGVDVVQTTLDQLRVDGGSAGAGPST